MISHSHDATANRRPVLDSAEIHEVLSMTLIANLDTLDDDWVSISYPCGSCGLVTTSAFRPIATHTQVPEPPGQTTTCIRDDRRVASGLESQRGANQGSGETRRRRG